MSEGNYFFKFKYQRFLTSTLGWKEEEQGAYLRLLIVQFDQGAIPSDLEEIAAISPAAKKHWAKLSKKFKHVDADGRLYNQVMREEWNKANGIKIINKENGSKGGRPKKLRTETETKPNGFPEETEHLSDNNRTDTHTNMVTGLLVTGSENISKGAHRQSIIQAMKDRWMNIKPDYPFSELDDMQALFAIGEFIGPMVKSSWLPEDDVSYEAILGAWAVMASWISLDSFYRSIALSTLSKTKNLQTIWQKSKEEKNEPTAGKTVKTGGGKSAGAIELANQLAEKLAARG